MTNVVLIVMVLFFHDWYIVTLVVCFVMLPFFEFFFMVLAKRLVFFSSILACRDLCFS